MFDVGFWELCLIGLISLLVIGPERLPKVARLAGFWVGKSRHIIASVKQEINEELRAEEIRQILKEQTEIEELKDVSEQTNKTLQDLNVSLQERILDEPEPESTKSRQNERK